MSLRSFHVSSRRSLVRRATTTNKSGTAVGSAVPKLDKALEHMRFTNANQGVSELGRRNRSANTLDSLKLFVAKESERLGECTRYILTYPLAGISEDVGTRCDSGRFHPMEKVQQGGQ